VNISEYKRPVEQYKQHYGSAALKKDYIIANADEAFYSLVGANSCYTMLELLHPDDVEDFLEAEKQLAKGPQHLVVRLRCYDNEYRCLYIILKYNGEVFDGFRSFDMEFCNFMELKDRYVIYLALADKYREFMALSSLAFFEYTFATDEFKVYRYVNVKSVPIMAMKLDEIRARVYESALDEAGKADFDMLYESVKNGMERFEATIMLPSDLTGQEGAEFGGWHFKGRLIYKQGAKEMAIGIISSAEGERQPENYYLTENAFDAATGLLNKRAINEYVIERLQECRHTHESVYLAIMDVDDFKKVNDTFGHKFGDEVLTKVAELVLNVMDSRGAAGRFGGDEFMILFENVKSEKDLRLILKTIAKNIMWTFQNIASDMAITTSWGIAKYPDDGEDYDTLFKKADKALYIAKAKGKSRYIIYDEKKHGNIASDEEIQETTGIRARLASDERKTEVVQEIIMELHGQGKAALWSSMEKLCAYFDIDGAAVYVGEDMRRSISIGKYMNPINNLTCMHDEAYRALFDAHGIYMESTISRLSNSYSEAYRLYVSQENGKFLQCMATRGGEPAAVVAFDFFNRSPKLGVMDYGMITVVGTLMAQIAAE